jgi:coiled-coil domain-containing protein 55
MERRVERQVQKEREEEGAAFADKESFVTSAYRAKLEEFKIQEEIERREEQMEGNYKDNLLLQRTYI